MSSLSKYQWIARGQSQTDDGKRHARPRLCAKQQKRKSSSDEKGIEEQNKTAVQNNCGNSRLIATVGSDENGHQAETVQACPDAKGLSTYTKES